jgi:hypothetical protein
MKRSSFVAQVRGWLVVGGAVAAVAACKTSSGGAADAAGPAWWQPAVGEAKDWDIQLAADPAKIDVSAPRAMYDLDLWALVPKATTLDYGDGAPISVPPGALAGTIATLHARTPRTVVICHVETGILDLALPDAAKFPGYNADPAQIPDGMSPAAGSVIGWHVGTSTKRWLDLRQKSRLALVPVVFKRFELAQLIGCDGVDPDRNLAAEFATATGFPIQATDSYAWFAEIAKQGHARMLSTGMHNGEALPSQVDMEAANFDWMILERCGDPASNNCDTARPFINLGKAVLAIDYDHDSDGATQAADGVCMKQRLAMIADGIYKDVALTSAVRTPCNP